jgi:hypothetical protein
LVLAFVVGWIFLALDFPQTGWDFTAFYIAANSSLQSLYDRSLAIEFGNQHLAPLGINYYPPFVRPALFSLYLRPLALLDYWPAFWVWAGISLAGYTFAVFWIARLFKLPPEVTAAHFAFFPAMWGVATGQDAGLYLLAFTAAILALGQHRDPLSGLLLAACTYKFNLVVLIPLVLLLKRRHRAFGYFAVGTFGIVLASAALADPRSYLNLLARVRQECVNFKLGGLRGLLESYQMTVFYVPVALVGCAVLVWFVRGLNDQRPPGDHPTTLLISTHSMWYDRPFWFRWPLPGRGVAIGCECCVLWCSRVASLDLR